MARSTTFGVATLAALVAASIGCKDTLIRVPQDLPRAATVFACGPADGPAVAILLAEQPISNGVPATPFVSIYIDRSISELLPGTYAIGNPDVGIAINRQTATAGEGAISGAVRIFSVTADRTVRGEVTATFRDGGIVGQFMAPWQERAVLCG